MGSATINLSAVIDTFGGTAPTPLRFTAQVMRGGQQALRVNGAQAVLPAPLAWYWSGSAWAPSAPALTDVDLDCYWLVELASIDGSTRLTRTVVLPTGYGSSVDFGALALVDPATLTPTPSVLQTWLTALGVLAPLASPALTGTPTAPTAPPGTNSAQIATTAFVTAAVQAGLLLDVPEWQPNTAYASQTLVLNPSGQIVQATAAVPARAVYAAGDWTILSLTVSTVATMIAQQAALDSATYSTLAQQLLAWTLVQAFQVVSATRDANEAITTASVVWPDGATGTFTTDTASTAFPGAIDAFHVTHVLSGTTKTVTQPAVTRDAGGAVTAQPALTVA